MKINWSREGQSGTPLVPSGTYKVKIDKHMEVTASTGTPQIRWFATITEGGGPSCIGMTLLDHTPLTEKALWKLGTFVRVAGVPTDKLGDMDTKGAAFQKVLDLVDGREMYWEVILSVYNGRKSNKVEGYMPAMEQDLVDVDNLDDIPDFVVKDKEPF